LCNNSNNKTDHLYDGVFSWHWHNGWREEIEVGSKWEILESRFDKEVKEKINNGKI
jgi:hypothetical protein